MIAEFFGMGKDGLGDVAVAMPYFAIGFLFIAIERVTTSIFYAMDENKYAYILIYGELILMGILATFVFVSYYGSYWCMDVCNSSAGCIGSAFCNNSEKGNEISEIIVKGVFM